MSQEILEMMQAMDSKGVQTRLVFHCAPLIAGLKISNFLCVHKRELDTVEQLLDEHGISYEILFTGTLKSTLLLYSQAAMTQYFAEKENVELLQQFGYKNLLLESILTEFKHRYAAYMQGKQSFPHEVGLLLGYPAEDVRGYVENEGKNSLYTGYWKVYDKLSEKRELFKEFEQVKEQMLQMLSAGFDFSEIINCYAAFH